MPAHAGVVLVDGRGVVLAERTALRVPCCSAAALSHPNLVPIYDAGTEEGALYIAMEYVAGESLDDVMKSDRVLTYKEVADLVLQIGSALDYVHSRGIVHRDIKPANILLTRAGIPKITDFGVARQASSELTATGTILGTPTYMSPEQITGHKITGASDQFSLAILLYEMLTLQKPFDGEGATTILYKIVHEQPQAPDEVSSTVPRAASEPLLRGLAKKPEDRFANCVEFAEAVRATLGAADAEPAVVLATGTRLSPTSAAATTGPDTAPASSSAPTAVAMPRPAGATAAATPAPAAAWWARLGLDSAPSPVVLAGAAGGIVALALLAAWGIGGGDTDLPPATSPATEVSGSSPLDPSESVGLAPSGPGEEPPESAAPAATPVAPPVAEAVEAVSFRITSQPSGAEVTLDGVPVGPTPINVDLDPTHRYTVRLTSDGYTPLGWAFTVANLTDEQQTARALFFPLRAAAAGDTPAVAARADLPPVDPVRIRGDIESPTVLEKSEPDFPTWAADEGLPSYVVLELVVDEQGYVRSARVLREVHPVLEEMALASALAWRLSPATEDGEPIAVLFNATVAFRKND